MPEPGYDKNDHTAERQNQTRPEYEIFMPEQAPAEAINDSHHRI